MNYDLSTKKFDELPKGIQEKITKLKKENEQLEKQVNKNHWEI